MERQDKTATTQRMNAFVVEAGQMLSISLFWSYRKPLFPIILTDTLGCVIGSSQRHQGSDA